MKKVKFIEIKSESNGWSPVRGRKFTFPNIDKKVEAMLKDGWNYCGFVPMETSAVSSIEKISLIFQKEINDSEIEK